jgi:DNA-binding transcriptional regulator GbsR (MarR family)
MAYTLDNAKKEFVQSWGAFGSQWGISKTMAQVHAHLLITPDPITADELMADLVISRGNVNMNVRELIDWGLVSRITKPGERKEYFLAEKDIYTVVRRIIKERKRKELEPMLELMKQLSNIEGDKTTKEYKTYKTTVESIISFSEQADKTLDRIVKSEESWFWNNFLKLLK